MVAAKDAEAAAAREQLARTSLVHSTSGSSALDSGGTGGTDGGQHEQAQRTTAVNRRVSPAKAWEQLNGSVAALREFVLQHQLQLADPRGEL
jgi:hypothetical protein